MLAPYPDAAAAMTVTTPRPPHGLQCKTWIAVGESPDTVTVKWLCVSAGTMRAMQCAVFSDESTIILKIATGSLWLAADPKSFYVCTLLLTLMLWICVPLV